MLTKEGYPVGVACQAVGLSRSSFYYRPRPKGNGRLKAAIEGLAAVYLTYGNRRINAMLRRSPCSFCVNWKRVRRLSGIGASAGTEEKGDPNHGFPPPSPGDFLTW